MLRTARRGRKKRLARASAKGDFDDLSRSLGRHNHLRAETPVAETRRRDNDHLAQFAALIETLKVSHQQFESACIPELFLHLLTPISACATSPVPPARTHACVRLLSGGGRLGSPADFDAIRGVIGPTIRCMAATWEKGKLVMRCTHDHAIFLGEDTIRDASWKCQSKCFCFQRPQGASTTKHDENHRQSLTRWIRSSKQTRSPARTT